MNNQYFLSPILQHWVANCYVKKSQFGFLANNFVPSTTRVGSPGWSRSLIYARNSCNSLHTIPRCINLSELLAFVPVFRSISSNVQPNKIRQVARSR